MIVYQQFRTKPDTNGNPRRGWLIRRIQESERESTGWVTALCETLNWVDEGYEGNRPLDLALQRLGHSRKSAADLGWVNVTPSEWRQIRKAAQK